jgi:hypothetical protein
VTPLTGNACDDGNACTLGDQCTAAGATDGERRHDADDFSAAGSYVLRLTASDSQLTSSADVTITVQPPL